MVSVLVELSQHQEGAAEIRRAALLLAAEQHQIRGAALLVAGAAELRQAALLVLAELSQCENLKKINSQRKTMISMVIL